MAENVTTELLARLLALDEHGFQIVGLVAGDDGETWVMIETVPEPVGCPQCGVVASSKDRRPAKLRDLEVSGRPVVVVWVKRVWKCEESACPTKSWTEQRSFAGLRKVLTERVRAEICRQVGENNCSVAEQARRFGVGWHTAMAAVEDHGRPLVDDPARLEGVRALGVDETSFLKATPDAATQYVTSFVDLDRSLVLDLVPGRDATAVRTWLKARGPEWRGEIEVCAIDPHRGYLNGIRAEVSRAVLVLDPFHAVRLANRRVDAARRRVQNETLGHRGRKNDPLYQVRKILLMGAERHTERSAGRLEAALAAADPFEEVGCVWVAKELLRDVYKADGRRDAEKRLFRFYSWCADHADIPEIMTLALVIEEWQAQLLNYFDRRYSNGRTEALNLSIKNVKRVGHGFASFKNYRLRVLLHTGVEWHTPQTARLRASGPRMIA
ncbi:MAG: ISL3 family transposase [Planctomycetes bacterium]|nr:ISL3 family transposase [Planctomycetota bacterium]